MYGNEFGDYKRGVIVMIIGDPQKNNKGDYKGLIAKIDSINEYCTKAWITIDCLNKYIEIPITRLKIQEKGSKWNN